jgi:hypothetical protein
LIQSLSPSSSSHLIVSVIKYNTGTRSFSSSCTTSCLGLCLHFRLHLWSCSWGLDIVIILVIVIIIVAAAATAAALVGQSLVCHFVATHHHGRVCEGMGSHSTWSLLTTPSRLLRLLLLGHSNSTMSYCRKHRDRWSIIIYPETSADEDDLPRRRPLVCLVSRKESSFQNQDKLGRHGSGGNR